MASQALIAFLRLANLNCQNMAWVELQANDETGIMPACSKSLPEEMQVYQKGARLALHWQHDPTKGDH